MKKRIFSLTIIAIGAFAMMAFILPQDQKIGGPWEIPKEYKEKVNPHKGDASLEKLGRATYSRHCRSCHGNTGLGDGPMTKNLKTFPGDFSDATFQKHTDGDIYYMSFIGRDEMPNFESKITDEEERWAVVNYIRSMKK
ncbi:MAG: c-type cytochrome [Bacteroidales bacterium]|nr:c-type cytochrome [Bacteroidales bacterium]